MKNCKILIFIFLFASLLFSHLGAQTLLLKWNFDESDSGTGQTADLGGAPLAPGLFRDTATRTGNTPGGLSLGAADVTASNSSLVYTQPSTLDGKLDNLTSLTISLWVNLQDNPANLDRIFRAGAATTGGDGFGFRIVNPSSGTISASNFDLMMDISSGASTAFGASLDADDKWLFLAITFDAALAAANRVALWVGSETQNVEFIGFATTSATTTGVLSSTLGLGGLPGATTRSISAYLDDFRIYSGSGDLNFIESIRVSNIPEPSVAAFLLGATGISMAFARRFLSRNAK
jgi:hypothetical protein